ncbi:hypothetical protein BLTE_11530 [Blastochloris tepida]|uniref:DUF927 domain-containing protein n=1 Tax=Blastochloris tepida TaxID=2233851 RepID=A0A348FYT5_9HYPH|nr:hypothetical protein BLTE_11530 [Blastochloris tepida]
MAPLGVNGQTSFFVDTLGQVLGFNALEQKGLIRLFRLTPNYLEWAWPRWGEPRVGKDGTPRPPRIKGFDAVKAIQCLEKAAGQKGPFDPADKVRGRGAWNDDAGHLLWHSGDAIWRVKRGKLEHAPPGEQGRWFYPRRPTVMAPWQEPVSIEDSPARDMFHMLNTWSFERGPVDAVIAIGGIGTMLIGGALRQRPHIAAMGDFGVGKTELNAFIKAVVGDALLDCANATEAGIRQRMDFDTLPVAIDEFEASEHGDNRRVGAIIDLMRASYSGGRVLRGGADHQGVEFQARSAFFASGINLPPMTPADRSRFSILNLGALDASKTGKRPIVQEGDGRMLLRQLMDAWPQFPGVLADWENAIKCAGLSGRVQNTYGTLFAVAQLLLGPELIEEAGLPVTDLQRLGETIASITITERAAQVENWRACLEHLLQVPIDSWRSGEKPSVGRVIEDLERGDLELKYARERLAAAGLGIRDLSGVDYEAIWQLLPEPRPERPARSHPAPWYLLAVPVQKSAALAPLFAGTKWSHGGWVAALQQGPKHIIRRDAGVKRLVKINRVATQCVLVDLAAYDATAEG